MTLLRTKKALDFNLNHILFSHYKVLYYSNLKCIYRLLSKLYNSSAKALYNTIRLYYNLNFNPAFRRR